MMEFDDFVDYRARDLTTQQRFWLTDQIDAAKTENDPRIDAFPSNFVQVNTWVASMIETAKRTANVELLCEWMYHEPIDYADYSRWESDGIVECMLSDSQREAIIDVRNHAIYIKS